VRADLATEGPAVYIAETEGGAFMGNELRCRARFGKQESEGKALLETSEILFRGDFRLKIPFTAMKSVKALGGELRIEFAEGKASFALGEQAEKWAHKILHPKSRIEKLGIKAGQKVSVIGALEPSFRSELNEVTNATTNGKVAPDADCVFLCAESLKELSQCAKIARSLRGAVALWIVYPKGRKDITENDVIAAGRKAGLKDIKVVGFSPTHTALKFVIPIENP
jgi:hypothetical protein